jgi:hypothetical protein
VQIARIFYPPLCAKKALITAKYLTEIGGDLRQIGED